MTKNAEAGEDGHSMKGKLRTVAILEKSPVNNLLRSVSNTQCFYNPQLRNPYLFLIQHSLAYLASNTKKVVLRTREVAIRKSTKGEVHGFPWTGKSTASRRVTIVELNKICAEVGATELRRQTSLLVACGLLCSVDGFRKPWATRTKVSVTRGT